MLSIRLVMVVVILILIVILIVDVIVGVIVEFELRRSCSEAGSESKDIDCW